VSCQERGPAEDTQGENLHEQIETAIRVYDKLLIVFSEAAYKANG